MAKREKSTFSPPALGGSSLLTVFAVLCLTVFALLSLSTVRADLRLAQHSRQAVQDYYAADARAQEVLARLRQGEFPEDVEITVADYAGWSGGQGWSEYSYTVPISDTRELQVEVRMDAPDDYEVLRWQVVNTGEWSFDGGLEIWDGDQPF